MGSWIGDAVRADGADVMEMTVDSAGATARITLSAWQLDAVAASRVAASDDSLAFVGVAGTDTLRLSLANSGHAWHGTVSLGERSATVEIVRLFPMGDAGWRAMVGTFDDGNGHVIGIAPFTEFGSRLMLIDYATGRIGPLYALSRDQLIVGNTLAARVFPADSLTLTRAVADTVERIRFAERGHPTAIATRVPTRDEEVLFSNDSVRLAGTLVLPDGPPPYPAIVLVHGSNAQTRDALGPWSRFLVAQGLAVLSYDKRGTGSSTGDWKSADFGALAGDATAAVRFLAARADIRRDRIGMWGVSQGGWILPIVAAQSAADVAFLVVHAGSGITVREQGVVYMGSELRAAGLPPASVAVGTRYQQLDDIVTATGMGYQELQRYHAEHQADEPWLWPPRAPDDWFRTYYKMIMDFDPAGFWGRVRCPVLLFFGEVDANVPPTESWPPIERALRAAGNTSVTMTLLPKANHVFLEARTGGRDEYAGLSRFAPGYFSAMADWLRPWTATR